jgi:hypothetical protein
MDRNLEDIPITKYTDKELLEKYESFMNILSSISIDNPMYRKYAEKLTDIHYERFNREDEKIRKQIEGYFANLDRIERSIERGNKLKTIFFTIVPIHLTLITFAVLKMLEIVGMV